MSRPDWVPLFLTPKTHDDDTPLRTTTTLPDSPRRTEFLESSSSGSRSSWGSSTHSSPSSEQQQHPEGGDSVTYSIERPSSPPLPFLPGLSDAKTTGEASASWRDGASTSAFEGRHQAVQLDSTPVLRRTPRMGNQFEHSPVNRQDEFGRTRTIVGGGGQQHLRRRSSVSAAQSHALERGQSLTSFIDGHRGYHSRKSKHTPRSPRIKAPRQGLRCRSAMLIASLAFVVLFLLRSFIRVISPSGDSDSMTPLASLLPHRVVNLTSAEEWIDEILPILYDSLPLRTVPYPLDTHPPTPSAKEARHLSLADYVTTRFGSHFGFPARTDNPESHLWLTTATGESCKYSLKHLQAFVRSLDGKLARVPHPDYHAPLAEIENAKETHVPKTSTGKPVEPVRISRKLVVMCLDGQCVEHCARENWYCYTGFAKDSLGYPLDTRRQLVKLRGTIELLSTGRRIFTADGEAYFRDDPLAYLGPLDRYDLQIPDSWTSFNTRTGFALFNPTQNVISLLDKSLEVMRAPPNADWHRTNILLDPKGYGRHSRKVDDVSRTNDTDHIRDAGYGQGKFISPWGKHGGTDVKILNSRKFRSSSGRLDGLSYERVRSGLSAYFFCPCCEDLRTTDYIAGSLGYHHPSVALASMAEKEGATGLPLILTSSEVVGDAGMHKFSMSLLLKIAHDTHRVFAPPLRGTLIASNSTGHEFHLERYVWRLFPVAHWSHGHAFDDKDRIIKARVLEPNYAANTAKALRKVYKHDSDAQHVADELSEAPLWLDADTYRSYDEMLRALRTGYFASTRVVKVENMDKVRGKKGWESVTGDVEMCYEHPDSYKTKGQLDAASMTVCADVCRPPPKK